MLNIARAELAGMHPWMLSSMAGAVSTFL